MRFVIGYLRPEHLHWIRQPGVEDDQLLETFERRKLHENARLTFQQPELSSARDQLVDGLVCVPVVCQMSDSDGRKAALTRPRERFHYPFCDLRKSKPEDSLTFHLKY